MATIDIKHMKLFNNQVKMNSKTLMSSASDAKIQTKRKPKISLIIGGTKSGKSSYALKYTLGFGNTPEERAVVTTSLERTKEINDECSLLEITREKGVSIFEEEDNIANVIKSIPSSAQIILIDNISVWIANLIRDNKDSKLFRDELEKLLSETNKDIILISNIVGLGIIPEANFDREFRDESGRVNQQLAALANNVILMVAGIPIAIKGELL